MPNPENVIGKGNRFKKGQSGNPKGRPKLPNLREILDNVLGKEADKITAAEAILMAMRKKALSGDVRAAEFIFDRAYHKAVQPVEHSGEIKTDLSNLSDDDLRKLAEIQSKSGTGKA